MEQSPLDLIGLKAYCETREGGRTPLLVRTWDEFGGWRNAMCRLAFEVPLVCLLTLVALINANGGGSAGGPIVFPILLAQFPITALFLALGRAPRAAWAIAGVWVAAVILAFPTLIDAPVAR